MSFCLCSWLQRPRQWSTGSWISPSCSQLTCMEEMWWPTTHMMKPALVHKHICWHTNTPCFPVWVVKLYINCSLAQYENVSTDLNWPVTGTTNILSVFPPNVLTLIHIKWNMFTSPASRTLLLKVNKMCLRRHTFNVLQMQVFNQYFITAAV